MVRTRASSSSAGAPQKKTSSGGGAPRSSGPKVIARAAGGTGSPARSTYGLQNHARKCSTPDWQRPLTAVMPGLELNPNALRKRKLDEDEESGNTSSDDRDVAILDEQPAVKKQKKKKHTQPKEKKERKKKEGKAEGGKKRGKSAYIFFTLEKRAELKAQNPDLKFGEITKKLAEAWKALTAEEKKKYEDMAQKDKEEVENAQRGAQKSGEAAAETKDDSEEGQEEGDKEEEENGAAKEQIEEEAAEGGAFDSVILDDMGDDFIDSEAEADGTPEEEKHPAESKARKTRRAVLEDEDEDD